MDQADLESADLRRVIANAVTMREANLRKTELLGANFQSGVFFMTTFNESHLQETVFSSANVAYAKFRETTIYSCDFAQAQLSSVDFFDAEIQGSKFNEAELYHVDFTKALVSRCSMSTQKIDRLKLLETQFSQMALPSLALLKAEHTKGLALCEVEISETNNGPRLEKILNNAFGDTAVTIQTDIKRPSHWAKWFLFDDFFDEWDKWLDNPDSYTPPPPPPNAAS